MQHWRLHGLCDGCLSKGIGAAFAACKRGSTEGCWGLSGGNKMQPHTKAAAMTPFSRIHVMPDRQAAHG